MVKLKKIIDFKKSSNTLSSQTVSRLVAARLVTE